MADTFKKIFDTSISMADVEQGGEVTVLTTDADTSVVIKDVKTKGGNTSVFTGVDLTLDGYEIASGISVDNGAVSGTQIIPPSSTVKAKLSDSTVLAEYDVIEYASTFTNYTWDISSINLQTGEVIQTESVPFSSGDVGQDYTRVYRYERVDGKIRYMLHEYNGNNAAELRIVNENNTSIYYYDFGYNGFAYGGGRYCYYSISNYLYRFDLETDTETSLVPVNVTSSYPYFTHCKNGNYEYVIGFKGSAWNNYFVYDVTNGTLNDNINLSSIEINNTSEKMGAMVLDDGKIVINDNAWFTTNTYGALADYCVIDPFNSYSVTTNHSIGFSGNMASLGAANSSYVYGGFQFHPSGKVFIRGVDATNGSVLYSTDWNFNTPSDPTSGIRVDFTSSNATSYDVPVGDTSVNQYGKLPLSIAFNVVNTAAATFDIAAFGIESV